MKVTMYGDKLFAINEETNEAKLYSVKDVKKPLADWEIIELKEIKKFTPDFLQKALKLWESTGSVMMEIK